jgi:methyltransferase
MGVKRKSRDKELASKSDKTTPQDHEPPRYGYHNQSINTPSINQLINHRPLITHHNSRSDGRRSTLSIAVAASCIENTQNLQLASILAGQIARAAAVFNIDEVIVLDDVTPPHHKHTTISPAAALFARILQFMETPQYLKKALIPMHPDLKFAGILPPLDAPHHLRSTEWGEFREGLVVDSHPTHGSLLDVGLSTRAHIPYTAPINCRLTLRMGQEPTYKTHVWFSKNNEQVLQVQLVPSQSPRQEYGLYWGYLTRIAPTIESMLKDCPFNGGGGGKAEDEEDDEKKKKKKKSSKSKKGTATNSRSSSGYDLVVGTSERGETTPASQLNLRSRTASLDEGGGRERYGHGLVVFGGPQGLEHALANDPWKEKYDDPSKWCDRYVNTCFDQGSRTIRTEEAVLISLAFLKEALA